MGLRMDVNPKSAQFYMIATATADEPRAQAPNTDESRIIHRKCDHCGLPHNQKHKCDKWGCPELNGSHAR